MATREELLRMGGVPEDGASASPTVEELLKQGGAREEAPSEAESLARGAYHGAGMGFADEQTGALESLGGHLKRTFTNDWKRTGKGWVEDIKEEAGTVLDDYQRGRDESRAKYDDAERTNPVAYGAGQFGGAVATGLATGGASALGKAGLKGAVTAGGLEGAASGLGGSRTDLTLQDAKAYARAFGDALKGGALGTVGGAAGYGIGAGARWVGGKAKGALERARGAMRGEEVLAREAEEKLAAEAAQEAGDKAAGARTQVDRGLRNLDMDNRMQAKAAAQQAVKDARAKAQAEKQALRESEAPTQAYAPARAADAEAKAAAAAQREADRAAEAGTQVDKGLRAQHQENIAKFRAAEKQALREAKEAQAKAEALESAHGVAKQANKQLDAARASRDAKAARTAQKEAEQRAAKAKREGDAMDRQGARAPRPAGQAQPEVRIGRGDPKPDVDPETKVVQGYVDQGIGRRMYNAKEIREYRRGLAAGEYPEAEAEKLRQYVAKHADAIDNPDAFVRRLVERNMLIGKNKYPPGVVERVLRDRIGPDLKVASRAQVAARAQPVEQVAEEAVENPALLRQRERGFGSQNMGAARMGQETVAFPNGDIKRAQVPGDDPFHDAPTRIGLVRTSAPEGIPGENRTPVHVFQFRHPKTGEAFEVRAREAPFDDEVIVVDGIGPLNIGGAGYDEVWEANANTFGPKLMRDVMAELARAFPGRTRIGGMRATGANPGRDATFAAPEVTQGAGARPWEPEPTQVMDTRDAVIQGRADELMALNRPPTLDDLRGAEQAPSYTPPSQRRAPAPESAPGQEPRTADPFHDGPTRVGLVEVTPADDDNWIRQFEFRDPATGRDVRIEASVTPDEPDLLFVSNIRFADIDKSIDDAVAWGDDANLVGARALRHVLPDLARAFPSATRIGGIRVTGIRPGRKMSVGLPEVTKLMDLGDAVKQGRGEEMRLAGGGGSAWGPGGVPKLSPPVEAPTQVAPQWEGARRGAAPPATPAPAPRSPGQTAADAREARGGEDLRRAFVRGAAGPDAAALGLGGIAVGGLAGGAGGVAARGGAEVVKELAKNPAARARAITAFRLERLAQTRPEVYARVGGVLARAMEKGPEHYAAKRHVLLLTDPDLRAAEAEADAELQGLSDEELAARLNAGR